MDFLKLRTFFKDIQNFACLRAGKVFVIPKEILE